MFRYLKRIFSNIIEKNKTNTDKVKLGVSLCFFRKPTKFVVLSV